MPHFIAANYQQMLAAESPQEKIRAALKVYELGLRTLSLGLISQYLIRDKDLITDPYLNQLLLDRLPKASLDTWQHLFFTTLKVYEGNRDVFFIKELYDFYWDTSILPHHPRSGIEAPFTRLTQIRNEIEHSYSPTDANDWSSLCDETLRLLREVLGQLTFIQNYELIRVLDQEEQTCTYERHVGLTVTRHQLKLPTNIKLRSGWFYLNKQNNDFLLLDPLLIFWQDSSSQLLLNVDWDTAVFERFTYNHLQYLLSRLGKRVEDANEERITDFIKLVYITIREIKQAQRKAEKLTWWQLQEVAKDISKQRMATVREKYKPQLYLERNKVKSAFNHFLSSEKRGFILLGKSGVGKSNFMLALESEFSHERPDVCLLLYDAANLNPEISLTSVISQDFNDRLHLPEGEIKHIWHETAEIDGIERRTMLLCIDAINESAQGQVLLKQINDLVQGPWPWLKIVITSRPEAWRNIKYRVKLADALFYRETDSNELAVEMENFTYSYKLDSFDPDELSQVYKKYQQVYQVHTSFEELSEAVKQLLRDPLVLWLVTRSYQRATIPQVIKKVHVIPDYIQAMLRTGRLELRDEQFLKEKLLPLMQREGYYTNTISDQDIDRAGSKLFEQINVEGKLSDGRQVNQSFVNLMDAEILIRRDEPPNYEIAFKYERFYEYYLGQYIFEFNSTVTPLDRFVNYKSVLRQIAKAPYIWGAAANSIFNELQAGHHKLIQDLALEDDRTINGVLLDAIIDFGELDPDQVRQLLLQLITFKQEVLSTKRLAIEAASRLGNIEVLELAAKNTNRVIREMALLPIYALWERNNDLGYLLLHNLVQETVSWLKTPQFRLIEFLVQISLLIYGNSIQHNSEAVKPLLELWQMFLKQFSWLIPTKKHKWLPLNFFKKSISRVALKIVSAALEANLSSEAARAVPDFFKWSAPDREKVAHIAKFMNVSFGELSSVQDDILHLAPRGNGIAHVIIQGAMLMHLLEDKEKALPVIKYIHDSSDNLWTRGTASGSLGLFNIVSKKVDTQLFELSSSWSLENWRSENLFDPGSHIVADFLIEAKLGLIRSEHLVAALDISTSFGDTRRLRDTLEIIEALKAVGLSGYPQYMLNSLENFFYTESPKVQEALASAIARIENFYPDAVDYFMSLEIFPPTLRYKVKQSLGTGKGGEISGVYMWAALTGSILIPKIRQVIIDFSNDMVNTRTEITA